MEGRDAPFQPSPDTLIWQSSQCPAHQSPIKYSITLFSNFCPYQPWGPKGLASTVGRGNVFSAAICGDGRTYWKSKQEQEESAEGRSPGSGQAPLWPGITALWKEGVERGELHCIHTHRPLYIHVDAYGGTLCVQE